MDQKQEMGAANVLLDHLTHLARAWQGAQASLPDSKSTLKHQMVRRIRRRVFETETEAAALFDQQVNR